MESAPAERQIAAETLARTSSPTRAAQAAQVPVSVIRQWQRDPEFAAEVLEYGTELLGSTVWAILEAAPEAVKVLREELLPPPPRNPIGRPAKGTPRVDPRPRKPAPSRIRAAQTLLQLWLRSAEIGNFMHRLAQVEAKQTIGPTPSPAFALPAVDDEEPPPCSSL